ncbi:hypothetical protein ONE63_008736 [Megalurothrips usitatus]|uniref:DNA-directed DNA polymerase family A palm domain-containing protein n=1 Tax=Megalurothrips usitatus TaxID=439358 RepID=A0AAV7XQG8_9NEOP|nr:hypothetical protein ONE63_008736 [Megalurothrips usitatus]
MEVLEALERRFQPASASAFGRPNNRQQPPPFFGGARRVSAQPQNQHVWGSSCGPVPSSGPNLSSQQVPHHRQPAFLDETLMGELSGIMRENVVEIPTQRFNNSPLQNSPTAIIPYAESNNSSPMSSFDELLGIGPVDSFMPAGDLYSKPASERGWDCTEGGAATGTDVFNDSNVFSPLKNTGTDDTLNDSNLSSPPRNAENDDTVVLNDCNLSSPPRNTETDHIHFCDPLSSNISLNSNKECSSTTINFDSQVHLNTSFELLPPNQTDEPRLFSRSCSPNEELARSAKRSPSPLRSLEKSISILSGSSFDDSLEIEGSQVLSEDDFNCNPRVLSPNIPSKQSPFRLNTPKSKMRKFLGTPFKRALSSTCIFKEKSNEIPEVEESQEKENCEPAVNSRKSDDQDLSFDVQKQLECTNAAKPADHSFASPFAKTPTPTDPRPVSYFPIFHSTHSKRKACDDNDKLRAVSSASCKKKLKFMVPYKKPESQESPSTHQKIQELAAKFAKQMSDKKQFQVLSETLSIDIGSKLLQTPPQETSVSVQFRGGFCQLNRPKTCTAHVPVSILLRVAWSSDVQYLSVLLERNTWAVSFLKTLFSSKSRKICFEAQALIQLLVDKFGFNVNEVSSQWLILDPLVGCWLLKPDEPPRSFDEVSAFLQLAGDCRGPEMLLSKLSHCAEILYEKLTKNGLWKIFLHIEMRITPILACMELQGILVNLKKLREMEIILKSRLETVQAAAFEAAGMHFQLTSPQQLSAILYEQLKLDKKFNISVKETDKHHKSTSEAELIKFKDCHPLPRLILEFRSLHKHKTTYVDALLGHIADNCIFVTWDQTSAATGRITSNEPNIQSIPKQPLLPEVAVRTAFIARPGFSFLAADFQHIELRVFAHLSKDTALIRTLSQDTDVFKVLGQQCTERPAAL